MKEVIPVIYIMVTVFNEFNSKQANIAEKRVNPIFYIWYEL